MNRDTGTQHKLRLPPELKEKITESAKENNRSINAEIVSRLEKSFQEEKLGHQEIVAQVVQDFTDKFLEQLEKHRLPNK